MFVVKGKVDFDAHNVCVERTDHVENRYEREVIAMGLGRFELVNSFIVDRGHANGDEIHSVYRNGVVCVVNCTTLKLITYLIARPGQLKRYGISDTDMLKQAYSYVVAGYNLI